MSGLPALQHYKVDDRTLRHDIVSFVSSVRTLAGRHGQHQLMYFSAEEKRQCLQGFLGAWPRPPDIRKQDNVCDGVFLKQERLSIDETEWMHQGSTPPKTERFATHVI